MPASSASRPSYTTLLDIVAQAKSHKRRASYAAESIRAGKRPKLDSLSSPGGWSVGSAKSQRRRSPSPPSRRRSPATGFSSLLRLADTLSSMDLPHHDAFLDPDSDEPPTLHASTDNHGPISSLHNLAELAMERETMEEILSDTDTDVDAPPETCAYSSLLLREEDSFERDDPAPTYSQCTTPSGSPYHPLPANNQPFPHSQDIPPSPLRSNAATMPRSILRAPRRALVEKTMNMDKGCPVQKRVSFAKVPSVRLLLPGPAGPILDETLG
ncbi:hypothetical protein MKEN_01099500 [Mycena kentingensis (nom. inval.)]|nr:hypothetical protein MKEN_01099500 [Mycena kentingensis (nom. inval.)]